MRLNIASTFDTATAARTIEALDTEGGTSGRAESHARPFRIVVLDTVTVLLGPHLSGISSQGSVQYSTFACPCCCPVLSGYQLTWVVHMPIGHAEMTMFMRLLRTAAQKHGLCILVGTPSLRLSAQLPVYFGLFKSSADVNY